MNKGKKHSCGILFLVFVLASVSCDNQIKTRTVSNVVIIGKEFPLNGTFNPWSLQIIDSIILIRDFGDSYSYHVHNKNSLQLTGKFGMIGTGPGEYLSPDFMYQNQLSGDMLYFYDNTRKNISFVSISEAKDRTNYSPRQIKLSKRIIEEAFPLRSAVITADSFIVGSSQNNLNLGRFFCYEIATGKIIWTPYFPEVSKKPHYMMQNELYSNRMSLRPDGNEIAAASLYFRRIDILDKKGVLKRSVIFEDRKPEPDFTSANSIPPKGANQYFQSIAVTQQYIYVLNKEKTTDVQESIEQFNNDTITMIITGWDKDNANIRSVKLTPRVFDVAIDKMDNKLYGLRANSSSIFIYDLKDAEK